MAWMYPKDRTLAVKTLFTIILDAVKRESLVRLIRRIYTLGAEAHALSLHVARMLISTLITVISLLVLSLSAHRIAFPALASR